MIEIRNEEVTYPGVQKDKSNEKLDLFVLNLLWIMHVNEYHPALSENQRNNHTKNPITTTYINCFHKFLLIDFNTTHYFF